MGREILDKVLETLFPVDEEKLEENTRTNQGNDDSDHLPVTKEEMTLAIQRMGRKNTAPAPDGMLAEC